MINLQDIESIECIGDFNEEVYDIEIDTIDDKLRVFFANDILVHNSVFFSMAPVINSCDWENISNKDKVLSLHDKLLNNYHTTILDEYAKQYNVENVMSLKLEKYAETCIVLAKKSYIANVLWDEGIQYDPFTYIYTKGFDIVKSNTAPFSRKKIMEIIHYLFNNPDTYNMQDLLKMVKSIKKEFEMLATPSNIEEISLSTSTNKYSDQVLDDVNEIILKKGAGPGSKAASYHNWLLNQNPILKTKYNMIATGDKIKYFYTTDPLHPIFGYIRGQYPYEFDIQMDIDLQFAKTMLNILNRLNKALNLQPINDRLSMMFSLFEGIINNDIHVEEDDEDIDDDENNFINESYFDKYDNFN